MRSLIAVDWGSSNLRAWLLTAAGDAADFRESPAGVRIVQDRRFADILAGLLAPWLAADRDSPIVMCGMVGSRQGWIETPYLPCPLDPQDLARALVPVPEAAAALARPVYIVPGVTGRSLAQLPDVMRGEETQLVGALHLAPANDALYCLPGTHSKWARVRRGRLESFSTAMTGEIFALLREHSLIGRLLPGCDNMPFNPSAFGKGLDVAGRDGGPLNHLFSTRARVLLGDLPDADAADYLSGLLIGHECLGMRSGLTEGTVLSLVGSANLLTRYELACEQLLGRRPACIAGERAVQRGLLTLARNAQLLGQA